MKKVGSSKGISMILVIAFLIIFVTVFFFWNSSREKQQKSSVPDVYFILNSVTVDNFEDKVASNDKTYIYVGRPDCKDCELFEPVFLKKVTNKNLQTKINYLNIGRLKKNESKWDEFETDYNILYTPTLAVFQNGKLMTKAEWTPENGVKWDAFEEILEGIK